MLLENYARVQSETITQKFNFRHFIAASYQQTHGLFYYTSLKPKILVEDIPVRQDFSVLESL
jgi:hypothetical protein